MQPQRKTFRLASMGSRSSTMAASSTLSHRTHQSEIRSPFTRLFTEPPDDKLGSLETYNGQVGLSAKLEFARLYKHRIRINSRLKHRRIEASPAMEYLN